MMLERFYPDEYLDSTYSIDFRQLFAEGYRGLIFDIDNTIRFSVLPSLKQSASKSGTV